MKKYFEEPEAEIFNFRKDFVLTDSNGDENYDPNDWN